MATTTCTSCGAPATHSLPMATPPLESLCATCAAVGAARRDPYYQPVPLQDDPSRDHPMYCKCYFHR